MTGEGERSVDREMPVEVDLELARGRSLEPVGRLVAAGLAGRLGLTVDRVLRLDQAVDVALRWPGADRVRLVHLVETGDSFEVAVGPLDARRAEARELEHELSLLVDQVGTRRAGTGEVWVDMRLHLEARAASSCPA